MASLKTIERRVAPENIAAAGALDYIYEVGENLCIYRIVDTLA